jgi:PPM family protein phosphatase
MGTTLTVAYSLGADLFTLHVGDTRCYLFRQGELTQLTRDHTVAQLLADSGEITPEQLATHKQRHVLTSAIGGHEGMIKADVQRYTLEDGDLVLLCSDGLSDLVKEGNMVRVLEKKSSPQKMCEKLVDMALEQGGRDNITVIIGRYTIPDRRS